MKQEFGNKLGVVQKRDMKFCAKCGMSTVRPYAMESGNRYFCQRTCWEAYRSEQPPLYPLGQTIERRLQ